MVTYRVAPAVRCTSSQSSMHTILASVPTDTSTMQCCFESDGLFVAEGRLVVERVVADGRCVVESLLLNAASLEALRAVARSQDHLSHGVSLRDLGVRGDYRFQLSSWMPRAGASTELQSPGVTPSASRTLSLFSKTSPMRTTSEACFAMPRHLARARCSLSPTCCDPLYRKAIRTSMGAALRVPFATSRAVAEHARELRAEGFTIVALSPREPSMTLDAFAAETRTARVALLLGTEGDGLTRVAESLADVRVRIPIERECGFAESRRGVRNCPVTTGEPVGGPQRCPDRDQEMVQIGPLWRYLSNSIPSGKSAPTTSCTTASTIGRSHCMIGSTKKI